MSILPRPVGPRALWADLKLFWSSRTRVQWIAATLAILIPVGLGVAFYFDGKTNIAPGPQLILIESWPANRTAAETAERVERDAAIRNQRAAARREDFQAADNALSRYGF